MLIHVSKFQDVQDIVYKQVVIIMDTLRSRMKQIITFMMILFLNLKKFGIKILYT